MSDDCTHIAGFVDNGIECWLAYEPVEERDRMWLDIEDDWFTFCPNCGERLRDD